MDRSMLLAKALGDAVIEAVTEAGDAGLPSGHIYAPIMALGFSLDQYEMLMAALVACRQVTKRGLCYYPVTAERPFNEEEIAAVRSWAAAQD
jgi:hypothetical protein